MPMTIHLLVEGALDEVAGRRVLLSAGHAPGTCFGKNGIGYIRKKIKGFNAAAQGMHFLVLIDLMDTGIECAPEVRKQWLSHPHTGMIFRVVKGEIESWLMADRTNLARFLSVAEGRIPRHSEELADPKRTLVNIARQSRKKSIRDALVPDVNSTSSVGILYNSTLSEFVAQVWDPQHARKYAGSLDKCLKHLERIQVSDKE